LKIATLTSFQILNQVKPVEEVGAKPIQGTINQFVAKNKANLGL
jgi:hypothetical protein